MASLPSGLTPKMVRQHLRAGMLSKTEPGFLAAERNARTSEEVVLDREGESDSQVRAQRCKAKGYEARIRSICDDLSIDHRGWNP